MSEYIDVCGLPYKLIERSSEVVHPADGNFGQIAAIEGIIWLNGKMTPEIKEASLVHEWIHGVFTSNGIDHNEQQVGILATELYRMGFRVKYIMPPKSERMSKK